MKTVEIIIPMLNEFEVLDELFRRLNLIKKELTSKINLIFTIVDDGSSEEFNFVLKEKKKVEEFKLIILSKNYGHQIALRAGIDNSSSDAVLLLDGDLQDPPELLSEMLVGWEAGHDVVHGVRTERQKESVFKKVTANLFYRLIKNNSDVIATRNSGDFKLLDKKIVAKLKQSNDSELYLRGAIEFFSSNPKYINYSRSERYAGDKKYSLRQSISLGLNGLVSFSDFFFNFLVYSLVFSAVFMIGVIVYVMSGIFGIEELIPGWASVMSMLVIVNIVQTTAFLFVVVYLKKILLQTSGRSKYLISNTFD